MPPCPQMMERRAALGLLAGTAALLAGTGASQAAYGDAARVFAGKITNKSGFVPYAGEGFALLLPAKWNPSPERDFPGTVLRCNEGVCNEGVGVGRFGAGFQRFWLLLCPAGSCASLARVHSESAVLACHFHPLSSDACVACQAYCCHCLGLYMVLCELAKFRFPRLRCTGMRTTTSRLTT